MKILLPIIILLIGFIAFVRFMEATSIFFPARHIAQTPQAFRLGFEDIYFLTKDNVRLNGWFIKAPQTARTSKAATVLFFHGNAGNIGDRLEKIFMFHQMGLNVFIIDYRGYGNSQGHPTEKGMYQDAAAAWDYVLTRNDVEAKKIIGYGESLGGAAAIDLAVDHPLAALISESSLSSAADMSRKILPIVPSFLLSVKLDSVSKVKRISAPKLFIHSPNDEMVPFIQSQKLFQAAAEPKEFLKILGSHNEGYAAAGQIYTTGIQAYLKKYQLI